MRKIRGRPLLSVIVLVAGVALLLAALAVYIHYSAGHPGGAILRPGAASDLSLMALEGCAIVGIALVIAGSFLWFKD